MIVELTIIRPLTSEDGAYNFRLPLPYFPKLIDEADKFNKILFNFEARIKSTDHKVTEVSHPKNFEIFEQSFNEVLIQKVDSDFNQLISDMCISYRTMGIGYQQLCY